jgi:hypothetical protein
MYMVFKGAKRLFKKIVCQPERERERTMARARAYKGDSYGTSSLGGA